MISAGEKKLFLIDAYALIYRSYFAFSKNPRITSKGFDVSAIYGFTNILLDLINTEKPSHLGVVFDTPQKTQRHIEYSEYKANRDAMPEGISEAIPYIKRMLDAFNIPILFADGYEADDVIGTLAKKAEIKGFHVYMMTPDKDFAQLITDYTFMYKPGIRGNPNEIWDIKKVCQKFDIDHVGQVVDFLGMVGDAVDNIPGIAGVGPKTASKLLKQHGSLEKIYESVGELEGKLKQKITISREKAFLSKKLATIITDAPIKLDENNLQLSKPNLKELKTICTELEFKRILRRVIEKFDLQTSQLSSSKNVQLDMFNISPALIESTSPKGNLISNLFALQTCIRQFKRHKFVGFFLLSTQDRPKGLSISFSEEKSHYVVFSENFTLSQCLDALSPVFSSEDIEKIFFDSKFWISLLLNQKIKINGPIFDIQIAEYLINPDSNRTLSGMAQKYNIETINLELLNLNLAKDLSNYLIIGSCLLIRLKNTLLNLINENKLNKLLYNVELPLVRVLLRMEKEGISINKEALSEQSHYLTSQLLLLEKSIFSHAKEEFNIASPKQLGEILFLKLELAKKPKKTKSGQFSTSEVELKKITGKHPIVDDILLYRTYQKLLSTYINVLPALVDQNDKKIHTTFNQTVTNTGRLSSSNPNLQNIPIRKHAGRDVRRAFVSSGANYVLMSADYSQIELRLIAELSNEENMINAFLNNEDIHASTASKVFNVSLNDVNSDMRSSAKIVNFGIIYGVSAFGLSEQSSLSRQEASELIKVYFSTYPHLKAYIDNQIEFARNNGYVESILGRKRYLRNINSRNSFIRGHDERNSVNMPIQGSAADIIKLAMVEIDKVFVDRNLKSKMLIQVHDELVFDVFLPEKETVSNIVKNIMEDVYPTTVPLKVDIGFGSNWLDAH